MQLLDGLGRTVERVHEVMPECIGLSVARADQGTTFTLAASDEVIAVLDAVQYLGDGPRADVAQRHRWVEPSVSDLANAERWPHFTRVCASAGVRSTGILPVTEGDLTIGFVHAYAATEDAFEGRREELTRVVDGAVPELLIGSQLSLTTRRLAEPPPLSLRGQGALNRVVGELAVHLDLDMTTAYQRLDDAAVRAGTTSAELALALMDLRR